MEVSTTSFIILNALILLLAFVIIPSIFNCVTKLWYLKKNSGVNGFKHESMFYDAKNGRIEEDQSPIH